MKSMMCDLNFNFIRTRFQTSLYLDLGIVKELKSFFKPLDSECFDERAVAENMSKSI
jgi:hypothetical protein